MTTILRKRLSIAERENRELTSRVRALESRLVEYAYIDRTVRKRSINDLPMELKYNCVKVLNDELIVRVRELEEKLNVVAEEKESLESWRQGLIGSVAEKVLEEQNGGIGKEESEENERVEEGD
jgi:hypothetical protein